MWDPIVSVPDHCLSFYFRPIKQLTSTKSMDLSMDQKSMLLPVTDNYPT